MGFRNRRRRGGGGGGGGGQHHSHHGGFFGGDPNGVQPGDDVGNKKSFKAVQHIPEDLGNRKDPDEAEWIPEDSIGNRVDAAPTHELSGVLLELDGKRKRRRPKGVSAPERVGRFLVGGVNPLIAGGLPRPGLEAAHQAYEAMNAAHGDADRDAREMNGRTHEARDVRDAPRDSRENGHDANRDNRPNGRDGRDGRDGRREPRRFESPDGAAAAHDVSDRRAQRFFDFVEDDRFEYTLKTTPEQKRKEGEEIVRAIVREAGRDATVEGKLLEDGTRPKVLVTIDDRGPAADVPSERRSADAQEPLFLLGNAALMSLNYLVNKVVNRFPDDRIRLAVLPRADEKLYRDALADHQRTRPSSPPGKPAAHAPAAPPAPVPAPAVHAVPVPVAVPAPAAAAPLTPEPPLPGTAAGETESTAPPTRARAKAKPTAAVVDDDKPDAKVDTKASAKSKAPKTAAAVDDDDDASAKPAKAAKPAKKVVTADKASAKPSGKRAVVDDDEKKPAAKPRAKKAPAVVEKAILKR